MDVTRLSSAGLMMFAVAALAASQPQAPNPYEAVADWAKMPEGRTWGSTSAVGVDAKGNIWVGERCGANTCFDRATGKMSPLDPILMFDASGKLVRSFGAGMLVFPHGFHVDTDGNIWVTDGQDNQPQPPGRGGRGADPNAPPPPTADKPVGHQVFKFSPQGKLLLTLGKAGIAGAGPDTFNQPSDVVTAPNGDIFVADGHGGNTNARIVKFSKDGKFIKEWGKRGSGPGEFDTPHAIAIDAQGRLFVGDRANNRIQIFDQDGKFLEEWKQFARPSGIDIRDGMIYVADSESNTKRNPGGKRGIYVGTIKDGKLIAFIPDPEPDPDKSATSGAEGVAADQKGTIYGAEVGPKSLRKYVKK